MIVAIEFELIDLASFRERVRTESGFLEAALTSAERAWCDGRADPVPSAAARVAAKTAIVRPLGLDVASPAVLGEVEIVRTDSGRPTVALHGAAAAAARAGGVRSAHVSLTHARDHAAAAVVLEG